MKIGIVILNYNTVQDTIDCVNSIRAYNLKYEKLVIVDNDSQEDIWKLYRLQNDKTVLLKSKFNKGFASGNNIGIRYLKNQGIDFIVLLNSDTKIVDKDFLNKMTEEYTKNKKIGVIGVKKIKGRFGEVTAILEEDISLGYLFWHLLEGVCKKNYIWLPFSYKTMQRTQRVQGCVLALTPSYFQHYNGMWKYTFLYREEVILNDLCDKVNLEIAFADTCIFHKQGSSSEQEFSRYSRTKRAYELQSTVQQILVKLLPYCVIKRLM